jgi:chromosome segregation ATPase
MTDPEPPERKRGRPPKYQLAEEARLAAQRGGASVEVNNRLSQIKRRIREWRSYDAATQNDDQDWLVVEVERLQADLAQKRKDIDYLLERQKDQLARADKLIDELAQARAERQDAIDAEKIALAAVGKELDRLRAENEQLRAVARVQLDTGRMLATENDELRAEVKRLKEEMAEWESAHMAVVELRGLVESHMDTARGQWECVAGVERLRANPDIGKLRTAWAAVKESWWQGDSEQAIAYMELDTLLGVDADGKIVSQT